MIWPHFTGFVVPGYFGGSGGFCIASLLERWGKKKKRCSKFVFSFLFIVREVRAETAKRKRRTWGGEAVKS